MPNQDRGQNPDTPSMSPLEGTVPMAAREGEDDDTIPPEGGERTERIWFDSDLYIQSDLMMQGISAVETVTFSLPRHWAVTVDPVLHLKLEHSAALIPERSGITLQINGQVIHSARLDESNVVGGELVVTVPRTLLQDYNEMKLFVVQHVSNECEDPFDPLLWTRVRSDSFLFFTYSPLPIRPDLQQLPYPIFDTLGYGPLEIALAGSQTMSAGQLDAIKELSFAFGRWAAYRRVEVQPPIQALADARSHVLLVGTPAENSLIGQVMGGQLPGAGEGLVAIRPNPANPHLAVLVVTGGDDAGVLKAAQAVAGQDRYQLLSGDQSVIREIEPPDAPGSRQDPLPVPRDKEDFNLIDIQFEEQTVRGYYAAPLRIPLRMEGDAKAQLGGAQVTLDYAYSALLDNRLSTMEVKLNGVSLRSVALDQYNGSDSEQLTVDLPYELLEPTSELMVVFHLFPRDFDPCVYVSDRQIWATLYDSSRLELARDHFIDLPDLGLLRYDLWPLGDGLRKEGVAIVVDDAPDLNDASAALQAASELGRVSTVGRPNLAIVPARSGLLGELKGRQILVLAGGEENAALSEIEADRSAATVGATDRRLQDPQKDLLAARVGADYPTIEQILQVDRTVTVVHAPASDRLPAMVSALGEPTFLYRLEGNLAALDENGGLQTLDTAEKKQVGRVPVSRRVQMFLRNSWWALGAMVLIAGFIVAGLIRAWGNRRGGQV